MHRPPRWQGPRYQLAYVIGAEVRAALRWERIAAAPHAHDPNLTG
ncbi:hypothetical protein SC377_04850 [Actinotignum sp. SLA_B059]|nr:hypothetical protein [Actinotignum sp. SLA_B059]MDY5127474.1 hypothetical protein [Actinotignum sp. SLA_B059]